jgi:small-conductance mechanosensitive channel
MKHYHVYLVGFVIVTVIGLSFDISLYLILSLIGIPEAQLYYQIAESFIAVVFGYAAIKLLAKSVIAYGKLRPTIEEVLLSKVISLLGYAIMVLLVLSIFEINITGLLVGAGFLGIVIGLASQATLGNLFAGVSMMAAKPFTKGERITFSTWQYGMMPPSYAHRTLLPGYSGVIKYIGLMYTQLILDDGRVIAIPNGVMNQAAIINYAVSNTINVEFRVELPINIDFYKFKKELRSSIGRRKKLKTRIKSALNVSITDIGISNYGLDVQTMTIIENETYVKNALSEIVFEAVRAANASK